MESTALVRINNISLKGDLTYQGKWDELCRIVDTIRQRFLLLTVHIGVIAFGYPLVALSTLRAIFIQSWRFYINRYRIGYAQEVNIMERGGQNNKWDILRILRKNFHFTAAEVGKNCNLSGDYINKIERGERPITLEVIEGYAKTLGVQPSTLMLLTETNDDLYRRDGKLIPGAEFIKNAMIRVNEFVLNLQNYTEQTLENEATGEH